MSAAYVSFLPRYSPIWRTAPRRGGDIDCDSKKRGPKELTASTALT
jgi:hypothetical protein